MGKFVAGAFGTAATYTDEVGADTAVNVDFRERETEQDRDKRGSRVEERHAIAHVLKTDVTRPHRDATLTVAGEVWDVVDFDVQTASHRLTLFISQPVDRSSTAVVET